MGRPAKPCLTLAELPKLDRQAVADVLGRSLHGLRAELMPQDFPEPFYIGRTPYWLESEVAAWIQAQADKRPSVRRAAKRQATKARAAAA